MPFGCAARLNRLGRPRCTIGAARQALSSFVTQDLTRLWVDVKTARHAVRDIAEMAQAAADETRRQPRSRRGARLHAVDEVAQVRYQEFTRLGGMRVALPVHLPAAAIDDQCASI